MKPFRFASCSVYAILFSLWLLECVAPGLIPVIGGVITRWKDRVLLNARIVARGICVIGFAKIVESIVVG